MNENHEGKGLSPDPAGMSNIEIKLQDEVKAEKVRSSDPAPQTATPQSKPRTGLPQALPALESSKRKRNKRLSYMILSIVSLLFFRYCPVWIGTSADYIAIATPYDFTKEGVHRLGIRYAVDNGKLTLVRIHLFFRPSLAKLNTGRTLLQSAVRSPKIRKKSDRLELIKILIEKGADVNARDSRGRTALDMALSENLKYSLDLINLLLDNGALYTDKDDQKRTLLHQYEMPIDYIEDMLYRGVEINGTDGKGRTPLHYAAKSCCRYYDGHKMYCDNAVEFLISKGADIDVEDNNGETPLDVAEKNGYYTAVKTLISHGAKSW
ncbi:MAG TPA: ankyrin repeat domain-containing protein [bacterium]|nr:ankyrin repeat domain-containing protein [bacterium]